MNTTARQCPKCRATVNGSELTCSKCGAAIPEGTKYADLGPTVAMPGAKTKGPPSEPSLAQDKLVSDVPVTAEGRVLGGVRLVRRIDHGRVAAIYLAHHLTLDMPVAVKVLSKAVQAYDATYVTRFEREAKLSSKITHQNLVNTKNFGYEHGIFFLVMDFVDGQNAGKLIAKGPLSEAEALRIVYDAAQGLAEAHKQNVIHRDVKPDNILVAARTGNVKLADLGLARVMETIEEEGAEGRITAPGSALGTPQYVAPEQMRDASKATPAADVYGMGATLFALLTGGPPFPQTNIVELSRRVANEPAPNVSVKSPHVSKPTRDLVARCLEKDPAKRPRDAVELVQELDALRDKLTPSERLRAEKEPPKSPLGAVRGEHDESFASVTIAKGGAPPPPPPVVAKAPSAPQASPKPAPAPAPAPPPAKPAPILDRPAVTPQAPPKPVPPAGPNLVLLGGVAVMLAVGAVFMGVLVVSHFVGNKEPERVASADPKDGGGAKPTDSKPVQVNADAEAKAKEEAEVRAKQDAEAKARQEAQARDEARAKQEADAKAKQDADAKAKQDADAKAKQDADAKAKQDADAKAKQDADAAKAKRDADAKAKQDADAKAKQDADAAKAQEDAEAKAEAERRAKREAEAKATREAEAKAAAEAEARERADAEAREKAAAEATVRREAEAKAKREALAKARAEAEAREKVEAEARAKADAAAKVKADAESAVSSLPSDQRVWDGHHWRRLAKDHVHGEGCGHFFRSVGNMYGRPTFWWTLYQSSSRVVTDDVTPEDRKNPEKGYYSYEGKLYCLPDHKHGDGCGHTKTADGWEEPGVESP